MYINNISIIYYLIFGILGLISGELLLWCNYRMVEEKKILSKDILKFKDTKKDYKYLVIISNVIVNI